MSPHSVWGGLPSTGRVVAYSAGMKKPASDPVGQVSAGQEGSAPRSGDRRHRDVVELELIASAPRSGDRRERRAVPRALVASAPRSGDRRARCSSAAMRSASAPRSGDRRAGPGVAVDRVHRLPRAAGIEGTRAARCRAGTRLPRAAGIEGVSACLSKNGLASTPRSGDRGKEGLVVVFVSCQTGQARAAGIEGSSTTARTRCWVACPAQRGSEELQRDPEHSHAEWPRAAGIEEVIGPCVAW